MDVIVVAVVALGALGWLVLSHFMYKSAAKELARPEPDDAEEPYRVAWLARWTWAGALWGTSVVTTGIAMIAWVGAIEPPPPDRVIPVVLIVLGAVLVAGLSAGAIVQRQLRYWCRANRDRLRDLTRDM